MEVIHELEGTTTLVRLEEKELHTKDGEKILQSKGGKIRKKKIGAKGERR